MRTKVAPDMRKLVIPVTRAHIDNAIQCNGNQCTLANAIRDAFPGTQYVRVHHEGITVSRHDLIHRYKVSKMARKIIFLTDQKRMDLMRPTMVPLQLESVAPRPPAQSGPAKREHQDKVNAARRARKAAGRPDRTYDKVTDGSVRNLTGYVFGTLGKQLGVAA